MLEIFTTFLTSTHVAQTQQVVGVVNFSALSRFKYQVHDIVTSVDYAIIGIPLR